MRVAHGLYGHQVMKMPLLQLWNKRCGEAHPASQENWDCPNRVSLKDFMTMTINCSHTNIRVVHVGFQTIVLFTAASSQIATTSAHCRCPLYILIYRTVDRRSMFTCDSVLDVHNSHLWTRDNPHAICENGRQAHFSTSFWGDIIGDVVGPYLLPDGLTEQHRVTFWKIFYRDCLKMCLNPWGRVCGFNVTEPQCTMGRFPAVAERDISRKGGLDVDGRLHGLLGRRI
jgi:hypothetical protein